MVCALLADGAVVNLVRDKAFVLWRTRWQDTAHCAGSLLLTAAPRRTDATLSGGTIPLAFYIWSVHDVLTISRRDPGHHVASANAAKDS